MVRNISASKSCKYQWSNTLQSTHHSSLDKDVLVSGRDEAATALNRVFSSRHENCNHESRCGREAFQLNYVTKAVALTNSLKLGSQSLR